MVLAYIYIIFLILIQKAVCLDLYIDLNIAYI